MAAAAALAAFDAHDFESDASWAAFARTFDAPTPAAARLARAKWYKRIVRRRRWRGRGRGREFIDATTSTP